MEKISIEYGGSPMKLQKSPDLIGIKIQPGTDATTLEAASALVESQDTRQWLGGFRLMRVTGGLSQTEQTLDAVRLDNQVEVATHVYHTADDAVPFVPTGEIYLVFAEGSSRRERQRLIERHGLEMVEAREDNAFIVRTTPASENPVKVAAAFAKEKAVAIAEPDFATPGELQDMALPSDSLLADQWHLLNTGFHRQTDHGFKRGADARVVEAWKSVRSLGHPSVIVAVIDDGFDLGPSGPTSPQNRCGRYWNRPPAR